MKSRICCTTFYTENFQEIGKISEKSLRKYAEIHGLDVAIYTKTMTKRPPAWTKILIIRDLFAHGYEYVFWVDADAVFQRYNKSIEDEISEGKDLYLVGHYINGNFLPNTGIMLIRNSAWSHDLLESIWNKEHYINHMWWENAAFLELYGSQNLQKYSIPDFAPSIDRKRIFFLHKKWNSIPIASETLSPIIIHFAGFSNDVRVLRMTEILTGKNLNLWKIMPWTRKTFGRKALSALWDKLSRKLHL